jgi:hypothetical protein
MILQSRETQEMPACTFIWCEIKINYVSI